MPNKKTKKSKMSNRTVSFLDRSGVVEVILLAATIAFFYFHIYLLSAIFAFGLGVCATYVVDTVRARLGIKNLSLKAKPVKHKIVDEFVVVGIVLLLASAWFFEQGLYPAAVVGAFAFGIAVTYISDRMKS